MKASVNTVSIPLNRLYEFPGNPNKQNSTTFGNLVKEIADDGFEEPLIVVPRENWEPGVQGYYVVSGNHRLKALEKLGYTEVDCIVHQEWDPTTAAVKVVRRNQVKGRPDIDAFTKMVDSLSQTYTHDQLADAMGFISVDEFGKYYQPDNKIKETIDPGTNYENLFDGMREILNRLFQDFGHTVPMGFMYFLYGNKIHLTVVANKKVKSVLNKIMHMCNKQGVDVNSILGEVLTKGLETFDMKDFVGPEDDGDDFEPVNYVKKG